MWTIKLQKERRCSLNWRGNLEELSEVSAWLISREGLQRRTSPTESMILDVASPSLEQADSDLAATENETTWGGAF